MTEATGHWEERIEWHEGEKVVRQVWCVRPQNTISGYAAMYARMDRRGELPDAPEVRDNNSDDAYRLMGWYRARSMRGQGCPLLTRAILGHEGERISACDFTLEPCAPCDDCERRVRFSQWFKREPYPSDYNTTRGGMAVLTEEAEAGA